MSMQRHKHSTRQPGPLQTILQLAPTSAPATLSRPALDPRFGHDFSQVQVSAAPTAQRATIQRDDDDETEGSLFDDLSLPGFGESETADAGADTLDDLSLLEPNATETTGAGDSAVPALDELGATGFGDGLFGDQQNQEDLTGLSDEVLPLLDTGQPIIDWVKEWFGSKEGNTPPQPGEPPQPEAPPLPQPPQPGTVPWQGPPPPQSKQEKHDAAVLKRVQQYDAFIQEASNKYGVPVKQIRAIIAVESGGKPEASSGAAWGLMQVTKSTWKGTQKNHADLKDYDFETYWKDPHINILFGTAVLKGMMDNVGVPTDNPNFAKLAVVAYNAGDGTVKKAIELAKAQGSSDPEGDCLKPEYLKPAIQSTKIYSYYLTGPGHKQNPHVQEVTADPDNPKKKIAVPKAGSTIDQAQEAAIDLKYTEVSKYPEHVQRFTALQDKQEAEGTSGTTE
jgi:hypothetical protein